MSGLNRKSASGCFAALALTYWGAQVATTGARAVTTCEQLKSTQLPKTTITAASLVPAGGFSGATGGSFDYKTLPAFCRVQGVIAPSSDSHIEFEVWMPASGWNGKYQGVGNGGFAGEISYSQLGSAMNAGYATSSTDTGHKGGGTDATWALGHPEKVVDYGYRAIHETAEKAKTLIATFYGEAAKHSYFTGCSNGGRQALMEAQRFPGDYDGIIAGAPAADFTRTAALFASNVRATSDLNAFVPPSKYDAIEAAVVAACDARDGVNDKVVTEPAACKFDPAVLLCRDAENDSCLTAAQIAMVKKLYDGLRTVKGQSIFPGFVPGGEAGPGGWGPWLSGLKPDTSLEYAFATQFFKNMVYRNASWDVRTFEVERDLKAANEAVGRLLNAVDPDLQAFQKKGGKLIIFHGWSDAALPPTATTDYHDSIVKTLGQKQTDSFVRTYMAPGLQHCSGGPGADSFGLLPGLRPTVQDPTRNMSAAIARWVEQGIAPSALVATKYKGRPPDETPAFTRLLCPYPAIARYKGTGSSDDSANYACSVPGL